MPSQPPIPVHPVYFNPGAGLSVRTREGWRPGTIVASRDEGRQFDYRIDTTERKVIESLSPWQIQYGFKRDDAAPLARAQLGDDGTYRDVETGDLVEPGQRRYEKMSPPAKEIQEAEAKTKLLEGRLAQRSWSTFGAMEIPSRLQEAAVLVDDLECRRRAARQEQLACEALIRRLKAAMLDFRRT
jgi:hypothetical protein